MTSLRVQIVRFVDEYQPGIIECEFRDADGELHIIQHKVPIFTGMNLWSDSEYPQPGEVRCEVLERIDSGRRLLRITIAQPDDLESTAGEPEFVVAETQVRRI